MQTSLPIVNARHTDFTNDDSDRQNSVHNSSNGIVGMFYAVVLSSIFWTAWVHRLQDSFDAWKALRHITITIAAKLCLMAKSTASETLRG
jgi:hypothetical protein